MVLYYEEWYFPSNIRPKVLCDVLRLEHGYNLTYELPYPKGQKNVDKINDIVD